jgi:cystathionine beta-synthase
MGDMKIHANVLSLIGNTPLVRLNRLVDDTMADLVVKLEHFNPGGSVKDRMAVHMVNCAEEKGLIKPGATLVESTSGNTGLGLAMAAAVKGYRCVFTIPDKMSKEKIDMLKAFGAEVIVTRTDLDHDHPESYVSIAKRIAKETHNAFYTDQYYNMDNPAAHYLTTGPELWHDTNGLIDSFVGGIGTGGTISGAGKYLKEKAAEAGKEIRVVCPDPAGSMYSDAFYNRNIRPPQVYVVEGIGHDFMVGTLDFSVIDEVMEITDRQSFLTARRLCREEGIFAGGSAGTAVYGALQEAKRLGPGKLVVCIIPDSGDRYISKFFDDEWMKDMGFLGLEERMGTVRELLKVRQRPVEFARHDETIASVAERMSALGISQMPLEPLNGHGLMMVHERDLLRGLSERACRAEDRVSSVATPLQGKVAPEDSLLAVQRILDDHNIAVAIENGEVVGVIGKIDMITFLTSRSGR